MSHGKHQNSLTPTHTPLSTTSAGGLSMLMGLSLKRPKLSSQGDHPTLDILTVWRTWSQIPYITSEWVLQAQSRIPCSTPWFKCFLLTRFWQVTENAQATVLVRKLKPRHMLNLMTLSWCRGIQHLWQSHGLRLLTAALPHYSTPLLEWVRLLKTFDLSEDFYSSIICFAGNPRQSESRVGQFQPCGHKAKWDPEWGLSGPPAQHWVSDQGARNSKIWCLVCRSLRWHLLQSHNWR